MTHKTGNMLLVKGNKMAKPEGPKKHGPAGKDHGHTPKLRGKMKKA